MLHHLSRGALALTALLATSVAATAQDQAALIAKKNEKLAQPWLQKASWTLDFDEAQALAKESGKPIFGYFTRSYAP